MAKSKLLKGKQINVLGWGGALNTRMRCFKIIYCQIYYFIFILSNDEDDSIYESHSASGLSYLGNQAIL